MKKLNLYAGPAILPEEVLQQAEQAVHNFEGMGLSILEISHRSKQFVAVVDKARALVKELLQLDNDHEIIFMHGGALSQFHLVPMNLLNETETASYFDTGTWAHGAVEEAKLFGNIHIACSSADKGYTYIPAEYSVAPNSKYLHVTSNNTIYGTQLSTDYMNRLTANKQCPLVCDMSSDIFSRRVDYNAFDLIYAGAQKNMGPAGTTLVIVNKNLLGKVNRPIPRMLDYRQHIAKESMLNTPSVFAIYVSYLTLEWIKKQGLENIEQRNIRKAKKVYDVLDASNIFEGLVAKDSRSAMNICFKLNDAALEKPFDDYCAANGIVGLKGHRTVGGYRASLYNAVTEEGVDRLVDAMKGFEKGL